MRRKIALVITGLVVVMVPALAWSQADKIDRPESKRAINKKIKDEEDHIAGIEARKKAKREGNPNADVSDLDQDIALENAKISGKKETLKAIEDDPILNTDGVDKLIQDEQDALDQKKKDLEELRKQEPKPREKIDKAQKEVNELAKKIEGKKEAKGALVLK
jgi:hypothetical protein